MSSNITPHKAQNLQTSLDQAFHSYSRTQPFLQETYLRRECATARDAESMFPGEYIMDTAVRQPVVNGTEPNFPLFHLNTPLGNFAGGYSAPPETIDQDSAFRLKTMVAGQPIMRPKGKQQLGSLVAGPPDQTNGGGGQSSELELFLQHAEETRFRTPLDGLHTNVPREDRFFEERVTLPFAPQIKRRSQDNSGVTGSSEIPGLWDAAPGGISTRRWMHEGQSAAAVSLRGPKYAATHQLLPAPVARCADTSS